MKTAIRSSLLLSEIMDKRIKLYPTQHDFLTCEDRFTAFIGGIGSGKTYAGCVKDLQRATIPGTLGIVVAPTYAMLGDATIRTFLDLAGDAVETFNKSDSTVKIKHGGEILFRSADKPDRLRGANLHYAHIDEGGLCPPGTWEIIIGRLRADGKAGKCWVTTTPKGRNWLFRRKEEMTVFKASTKDNPYLDKEFIASLERSYTGEFARQELDGEFISLEGLVYRFDASDHVTERSSAEFALWGIAIDEGYTNPAVILLVGFDGDGRAHVAREWYERGKLQEEVVRIAASWCAEREIFTIAVDASAAGLIADLRNNGMQAEPRKGRVLDGIAAVQNMLAMQGDGRPRLTVDPSCTNTINEFESYVWKDGKDEPVKENDHALDALRYLLGGMTEETNRVQYFDDRVQISTI